MMSVDWDSPHFVGWSVSADAAAKPSLRTRLALVIVSRLRIRVAVQANAFVGQGDCSFLHGDLLNWTSG